MRGTYRTRQPARVVFASHIADGFKAAIILSEKNVVAAVREVRPVSLVLAGRAMWLSVLSRVRGEGVAVGLCGLREDVRGRGGRRLG